MDIETAKDEIYAALDAMAKTLRNSQELVEIRYLERLLRDRDEMLTYAHYSVGIPVLELAESTGISWTQLYDVIDRVREEKLEEARARNPFTSLVLPPPEPVSPHESLPTAADDTPTEPEVES